MPGNRPTEPPGTHCVRIVRRGRCRRIPGSDARCEAGETPGSRGEPRHRRSDSLHWVSANPTTFYGEKGGVGFAHTLGGCRGRPCSNGATRHGQVTSAQVFGIDADRSGGRSDIREGSLDGVCGGPGPGESHIHVSPIQGWDDKPVDGMFCGNPFRLLRSAGRGATTGSAIST